MTVKPQYIGKKHSKNRYIVYDHLKKHKIGIKYFSPKSLNRRGKRMRCPYCKSDDTKVIDTREAGDTEITRRRRECLKCIKRFTTYERVEGVELIVVKKDKEREQFDRQKLMKGILRACEKRPVKQEKIEKMLDEIETDLRNKEDTEVSSRLIGKAVMEKLKSIDEVAYVRFASVYRKFKDVKQFLKEIEDVIEDKEN